MWSKCADENFHMTFFVCASAAKSTAPPLLILHGKRFNRDVPVGFYIKGDRILKNPKGFINYTLYLSWLELFSNSVPDSVARPFVLVYDECCSQYNDEIVKKQLILN